MNTPGTRPGPGGDEPSELSIEWRGDDDARRSVWPMSLALVAVVAVAAAGVAFASARDGSDAAPDRDDTAQVVDDETDDDSNDATPQIHLNPMGPRDGLDSKRHPVTVSPAHDLLDGQQVTVSGSEFPPDTALGVVMCAGELGGGAAQCQLSPYTPVQSDATGSFTVDHEVRRIIMVGGQEIDCADPPVQGAEAGCAIAVGAINDYDESGVAQVTFDGTVPPPPPPTLSVSPTTDLVDGQLIEVTVSEIHDDIWWWPMLCADLDGEQWCEDLSPESTDIGGTTHRGGPGTAEMTVRRVVGEFSGQAGIDCAEEFGRCWIMVWAGPRQAEPVPLGFDLAGPMPEPRPHPTYVDHPPPPLTVAPGPVDDEIPTETTVG